MHLQVEWVIANVVLKLHVWYVCVCMYVYIS